ncbi:MAG: zinc ribbon domain-containing protein [Oscillospiraceae bacterium]|nr:zinc ribbon domain-containing protein [Oscillospiraceae bacterium]
MAVKLHYTYTKYENCPEATAVSRSRERDKSFHFLFWFLFSILSILFCFADLLSGFCCVILSTLYIIYLIKFYDKSTQKKIQEALKIDMKNIEKLEKEKLRLKLLQEEKDKEYNMMIENAVFCPNCGADISKDYNKCHVCGMKI